MAASKQASKHTHARAQCSPASVGLAQARPNYQHTLNMQLLSTYILLVNIVVLWYVQNEDYERHFADITHCHNYSLPLSYTAYSMKACLFPKLTQRLLVLCLFQMLAKHRPLLFTIVAINIGRIVEVGLNTIFCRRIQPVSGQFFNLPSMLHCCLPT